MKNMIIFLDIEIKNEVELEPIEKIKIKNKRIWKKDLKSISKTSPNLKKLFDAKKLKYQNLLFLVMIIFQSRRTFDELHRAHFTSTWPCINDVYVYRLGDQCSS